MAYFGDEYAGLQVSYIWQETRRGTADAVRLVLEQRRSAESVIGWLGDSFFPVWAFGQIDRTEHEMVITAFRDEGDECARHRLDLHRDGRVLKAWRGTGPYIESGLWRVSRDFLEYLNPTQDGEYRMLPALDGYIQSGGTVGYIELPHRLHLENESSLDDSRLIEAMELFSTGKP
jgi:NDP-sugar pyrophosphorylase family protein